MTDAELIQRHAAAYLAIDLDERETASVVATIAATVSAALLAEQRAAIAAAVRCVDAYGDSVAAAALERAAALVGQVS